MKEGDIIQWEGKCGLMQGKVVLSNSGQFIVKMDNGHTFSSMTFGSQGQQNSLKYDLDWN